MFVNSNTFVFKLKGRFIEIQLSLFSLLTRMHNSVIFMLANFHICLPFLANQNCYKISVSFSASKAESEFK